MSRETMLVVHEAGMEYVAIDRKRKLDMLPRMNGTCPAIHAYVTPTGDFPSRYRSDNELGLGSNKSIGCRGPNNSKIIKRRRAAGEDFRRRSENKLRTAKRFAACARL